MTAHSNIAAARETATATEQFNFLRGRMVGLYAKLEQASADAILALDPGGKMPPTLRPRLKRLDELLLESDRPAIAAKIIQCIADHEDHLARRNVLVHAGGSLFSGGDGQWRWAWRMASPEERGWWTSAELTAFEKDLKSKTDRLCAHLERLAK